MILQVYSDAAYLVAPNAQSRAGGYHFLGTNDRTQFNAPVLILACIIKNVMASAAEAEIGSLYMNAREAVPLRICLDNLGHKQPPTPLITDNITACGIIRGTMKQKMMKAIDMRFNWLKCCVEQKQFDIIWEPGTQNLADYYTKFHSGAHHRRLRPLYLYEKDSPTTMKGCVSLLENVHKRQTTGSTKLASSITASQRLRPLIP